jgi:hypothetical protein
LLLVAVAADRWVAAAVVLEDLGIHLQLYLRAI